MIINKLVFLINVKDNFFEGALPSYKLTANNLNRDFVYVISPAVSSSVIYANFQSDLMNEGVDNVKMLLADETVDELVSKTAYYYETVKNWRVWKAPIPSRALRNIAMNRAGEIGVSFSVKEIIVPESSIDNIDYFIRSDEDTMENDGVYLVEIAVYGEYRYRDVLIKSGGNVVVKRAIISTGNTSYVRYSVDGSIGIGEFEETIDEDIGVAIISQLGNHEGRITSIEEIELVRVDNELLLLDSRVEDIEVVEIPRIDGELGSLDDRVGNVENVELPAINTELLRLENVKAEKTSLIPINDELIRLDNIKAEKSEVYKKAQVYTQIETDSLLNDKVDKTTTIANISLKKNITASALINNLREATDSLKGLMSSSDKQKLDDLWAIFDNGQDESFVDTITELLAIFSDYPEGMDIIEKFAEKADKDNVYDKDTADGKFALRTIKINGKAISGDVTLLAKDVSIGEYGDFANKNVEQALGILKDKTDLIVDDGDGTKYLADDGSYKTVASGGDENVQSDWNESDNTSDSYIKNKPTIPSDIKQLADSDDLLGDKNIQSDWQQSNEEADDYIKNKPTIPTVPTISTNIESDGGSDIKTVSPKAVKTYVDNKVANTYKPSGSLSPGAISNALLVVGNLGNVYNITGSFTTTADFLEGAGQTHEAGTNIVIVANGGSYKFDVIGGFVDLSGYATESWVEGKGYKTTDNDTKNTAGTTNKGSTKLFLAGAESQGANPQTYSNDKVYIGTDNELYSNGKKVVNTDDARLSDARTPKSHTHGSISDDGKLTNNQAKASGFKFVMTDGSNVVKQVNLALSSGTSQYLREVGTWQTPPNTQPPTISTNIENDKNDNTKTASAKAVYDFIASAITEALGDDY